MAILAVFFVGMIASFAAGKTHLSLQKSFYYDTWLMTTKFGVPADSTLTVKFRSKNRSIYADRDDNSILYYELGVYIDDEFDKAEKMTTCEDKRSLATNIVPVGSDLHGAWSDDLQPQAAKETTIFSQGRPHVYYFVLMDCQKNYAQKFNLNPRNMGRPQLELTLLNEGGDHFSQEEMGCLKQCIWLLIFQGAFGIVIVQSYRASIKQHERYMSPHVIMLVSLVFQFTSQLMLLFHLWTYSFDGEGVLPADILAKIFSAISEIIMSMLLIQLISGWTVTYQDIELDDNMEIYIPIMLFVVMVEVIITALTFIDVDSSSHRYHDFAGIQGSILLIMKLGIWAYFMYTFIQTKALLQRRSTRYYNQLFAIGSTYMLAVPMSIIVSYVYQPYERQQIFNFLTHFLEYSINFFLMYQVSYKGSAWQLGNLDSIGVLPFTFRAKDKTVTSKSNLD